MAIYGRGFPPSTQYQFTPPRAAPGAVGLAGSASMALDATGTMTQVTTTVAAVSLAAHRFRYTVEPAPQDFESVQRHLQRMSDEIAQSVNPIRSIADGGTGLDEVTVGSLMIGKTPNSMEAIPPGGAGQVLTVVSGKPAWAPSGGVGAGEANTATNVGVGGIGVVNGKVGVDLQFRSIKAASARVTVSLDAANKAVTVDVTVGTTVNTVCAGDDSRLSDARTPTGPAGGVLAGTYPSPGFAVDMATQAELDAAVALLVAADAAHAAAADPHPQYALDTDLAGYQPLADTRWDPITDSYDATPRDDTDDSDTRAADRGELVGTRAASYR